MKNVIKTKDNYMLLYPLNSSDMNYHLIDTENELDYLIDIDDVYEESEIDDPEEFSGLHWESFKELEDIENILEYSWKTL